METETVRNSSSPAVWERAKFMQSEHIGVAEVINNNNNNNNNNEIDLHDDNNGNQNQEEENVHLETVRNISFPTRDTSIHMQSEHIDANNVTELIIDNYNELDDDSEYEEELNLGDTSNYTPDERNLLFQRGLEYEQNFRASAALQCYMGCIQGLKNGNVFANLPQCLHKIAVMHSSQENYNYTAQFTQSEKSVYGTAHCEAGDLQQKIDEIAGDNSPEPMDLNELNIDVIRAEEYEHMAKLCWLKQQHQLALEYAGRCAKLRQKIYGKNHEKTKTSLSFFATVYTELRRQQYAGDLGNESVFTESTSKIPEVVMSTPEGKTPVSILRQRSDDGSKESDREKKQVRFHESVDEDLRLREQEELTSISMTLIQLAVCVVIMAAVFMWLYCSLDKNQSCQSLVSLFNNWIRAVKYYYRSFFSHR